MEKSFLYTMHTTLHNHTSVYIKYVFVYFYEVLYKSTLM